MSISIRNKRYGFGIILFICYITATHGLKKFEYDIINSDATHNEHYDFNLGHGNRYKRDVDAALPKESVEVQQNVTNVTINRTNTNPYVQEVNVSTPANFMPNNSIEMPLLGRNGTGIRKDIVPNQPTVSEPIEPDNSDLNLTEIFNENDDKLKYDHNLTDIKMDNHTFYNSTYISDEDYFKQYWENITLSKAEIHAILSSSHRRATTLKLSFEFPFYGHLLSNITIATGGFVYMGDQIHSWLAATQYIAPLMANFDTTLRNDSYVNLYEDGNKFTAVWENVPLQENKNKTFTFAVTLMKNGDIIFAYKDIPIPIKTIDDKEHPVKIGISDAYLTDKILFYVRRKTIYEYHRVSFLNYDIKSNSILTLTALPTCLLYTTCESCANHDTAFNCSWCPHIQRCSSGIDRNKQDWTVRNCDKAPISQASDCPVTPEKTSNNYTTSYVTDVKSNPYHETVVNADESPVVQKHENINTSEVTKKAIADDNIRTASTSSLGGFIAAITIVIVASSMGLWIFYAFKNPHTRSGQLLIKYRPSQWSWKRGEARYTAATIHM